MNDQIGPGLIRDTSKADAVFQIASDILPALRAAAKSNGYALAYHGSFARDIDIIAAPWTDSAIGALEIAEVIRAEAERVTGKTVLAVNDQAAKPMDYTRRSPEPKAHDRLGWSFHIAGWGTYIDLSVLSAGQSHTDTKIAELERRLDASYEETIRQSKLAKSAEAREKAMNEIIWWMLGERDDLPPMPEHEPGKPRRAFWWRKELRRRFEEAYAR